MTTYRLPPDGPPPFYVVRENLRDYQFDDLAQARPGSIVRIAPEDIKAMPLHDYAPPLIPDWLMLMMQEPWTLGAQA